MLISLVAYILLCLFKDNLTNNIECILYSYFSYDRLNMVSTILTVTTGFYLTISTIVSISVINVSKYILKSQSDKPIIMLIMLGIIENLLCIFMCTFFAGYYSLYFSYWLIVVLLMSIITFIKFINFVRCLLSENMKHMLKDIKENEYKENEAISILRQIEKNTKKK